MKHSEALKLIDAAYWRLARACEHTHDWDRYVAIQKEEERDHRKWKPSGIDCGLTKAQSVRLFSVQHIFERWIPMDSGKVFTPEAKDFLHIKRSIFAACSIAHSCEAEILKEFPKPYMLDWLKSIDYAELNKDPRMLAA